MFLAFGVVAERYCFLRSSGSAPAMPGSMFIAFLKTWRCWGVMDRGSNLGASPLELAAAESLAQSKADLSAAGFLRTFYERLY